LLRSADWVKVRVRVRVRVSFRVRVMVNKGTSLFF